MSAASERRGIIDALEEERAFLDGVVDSFKMTQRHFEEARGRIRFLLDELNALGRAEEETARCSRIAELEEEALDG